ncbi:MAG: DUF2961 domain-containing protein [Planctomycetota bacterium]
MRRHPHGAAWVAGFVLVPWVCAQRGLADLPRPRHEEVTVFSSHDPSGGNEDWGHFSATRADGSVVLARSEGPGWIRRIWSAQPEGDIEIRLDGEVAYTGPFAGLFDGATPPFAPPLAGRSGGGCSSWVPLAFRRECLVTTPHPAPIYYQIDVARGAGAPTTADLLRLALAEAPATEPGWHDVEPERDGRRLRVALPGAGEVGNLRVRWAPPADVDARMAWLRVFCDGEAQPCISAPAALVFGCDPQRESTRTLDTVVTGGTSGWRELRLPMPFRRGIRIEAEGVDDLGVRARSLPDDHDRRYLHADFASGATRRGAPFVPLEVRGAGHFVGLVLAATGDSGQGFSYLEGDERIVVDRREAVLGTGTEDFFGGGWYFRGGPFAHPFHAVAVLDGDGARALMSRWLLAEPVPFARELRFELEHGGGNDAPGARYATVAFTYRDTAAGHADSPSAWGAFEAVPQPRTLTATALWPACTTGAGQVVDLRAGDVAAWPLRWRAPAVVTLVDPGRRRLARWLAPSARDVRAPDAVAGVASVRIEPYLPAIRSVRVAGPFRVQQPRQGIDEVFAPEADSKPTAVYDVAGDGPRGWRRLVTGDWTGYFDLDAILQPNDGVVAYAALTLHCARACRVRLLLGSDDSVRVFCAGRAVHTHVGRRGSVRDQDEVVLELAAGATTLLLKVEDWDGGFGFHARLADGEGVRVDDGLDR